jgi:hypothetical protein
VGTNSFFLKTSQFQKTLKTHKHASIGFMFWKAHYLSKARLCWIHLPPHTLQKNFNMLLQWCNENTHKIN